MDASRRRFHRRKYTVTEAGTAALARVRAWTCPRSGATAPVRWRVPGRDPAARPHLNGALGAGDHARLLEPRLDRAGRASRRSVGEPRRPGRAGEHVRLGRRSRLHDRGGSWAVFDRILTIMKRDWNVPESSGPPRRGRGAVAGRGGGWEAVSHANSGRQMEMASPWSTSWTGQGEAQAELGADVAASMEPAAPLWPRPSRATRPVYGSTPGFGALCRHPGVGAGLTRLHAAIIRSHAAATGSRCMTPPCETVLLAAGQTLAAGYSLGSACPAPRLLQLLSLNLLPGSRARDQSAPPGTWPSSPTRAGAHREGRLRTPGDGLRGRPAAEVLAEHGIVRATGAEGGPVAGQRTEPMQAHARLLGA